MIQVAIPPVLFLAAIAFVRSEPPTFYPELPCKAEYFQHLVGESGYEVREQLKHFGIGPSGFGGSTEWHSFARFGQLEVHYSEVGKVIRIVDIE